MTKSLKSFDQLAQFRKTLKPVEPEQPIPSQNKEESPQKTTNQDPASSQLGQPYPILWSRIRRFDDQPRRYFNISSIQDLADNLEQEGQQVPVKVCTHPTEKGVFILIDGERRYRAFGLIFNKTGKEPLVKAFIEVIRNPKEHFRKSWIANLLREDISPLDEAAGFVRLKEDGSTTEELAVMTGKSVSYITGYLKLHTLCDKAKELMSPDRTKDTRLSVTAAIEIARSTRDPALQFEIAQETLERQLNIQDTRFLLRKRTGVQATNIKAEYSRKPSSNYQMFLTFMNYARSKTIELSHIDFDDIYINQVYSEQVKKETLTRIQANIESIFELIMRLKAITPTTVVIESDIAQLRILAAHLKELELKAQGGFS